MTKEEENRKKMREREREREKAGSEHQLRENVSVWLMVGGNDVEIQKSKIKHSFEKDGKRFKKKESKKK